MRLDRREFLKLCAVFASQAAFGPFLETTRLEQEVSFETAADWARFFHSYFCQLNDYTPLEINPENLALIVKWLYKEYVGQGFFDNSFIPRRMETEVSNITISSGSNCRDSIFVDQNLEEINPMYFVGLVAHELTHLYQQEICNEVLTPGNRVEETAQITKIEILAASAKKGNIHSLAAFLFDLREMCLNSALYLAQEENKMLDFGLLIMELKPDRHKFDFNFWQRQKDIFLTNIEGSRPFFEERNLRPLTCLLSALETHQAITGLALPQDEKGQPRVAVMDDFIDLMGRLPEFIQKANSRIILAD